MKQREMTVYRARGTSIGTNNPLIMLQGKWLRDLGFSTGDRISVTCDGGRLIVEKTAGYGLTPKGQGWWRKMQNIRGRRYDDGYDERK